MRLERHGQVFLLDLGDGENRLDAESLAGIAAALDEVERTEGDCALVTTARGAFYSNGYDLTRLRSFSQQAQRDFVAHHERLLARLVVFPVPTLAVLPGHAIGGGALLALAQDWRFMREDRGYFCLPEIDARIPFRPGMLALLRAKLPPALLRDLVLTGAKLGGREAAAAGVVDVALPEPGLLPRALERADELARKDRRTTAKMKERMYGEVASALRGEG
jgi:enoyl-CoA hydratase/carnithine racemase